MKEIEAKILEINRAGIEKKLRALGAQKIFDCPIDVRYFDTPNDHLRKQGTILRLRKKGAVGECTIKKNFKRAKGAKTADEIEISVDFNAMSAILRALGYEEKSNMKKRRVEYMLGKAHLELDKIPGIPWFLEIEAASIKIIEDVAKKLGFTKHDLKPWDWNDVQTYYKKRYENYLSSKSS